MLAICQEEILQVSHMLEFYKLLEGYKASLQDDRNVLLSHYHLVDIAQKVVGIGRWVHVVM